MTDFDAFESIDMKRSENPIWMLDLKSTKPAAEKAILDWLNTEYRFLEKENEDRFRTIKHNLARYKGIQYQSQESRSGNRDREFERAKFSPKLVVNLLALAVENRVSRIVKFKPAVSILPANDEFQDKSSSKIAKQFLDYIQYAQKFEIKNEKTVRACQVAGEGYIDIIWDKDAGPVHPDFSDSKKQPMLDDRGGEVKGDDGKPIMIDDVVHVGEVKYKIRLPLHIMLEKAESFEDANYAFLIEKVKVAELRREYPDSASEIKSDDIKKFYSVTKLEDEKLVQEVIKITFQHKKTKYLPNGYWAVFTKDVLLEKGDFKYDHGDFTFERLPGWEIPGEQHALSFFEQTKSLNAAYNNLTNMIVRNQALVAAPKWFVPKGSVKLESLGNDITIAQFQGSQPPVLAQQNPTPGEVFKFRQEMKMEFMEQAKLGDVMRGEPPPGIKAGVALQFLAEQEAQVANAEIVVYNEYLRRIADKTLKVAGQFYDKSDKRTIMVLGQNKSWCSMHFDPEHLARPYDIRIQNSSALPDSKAARTQYILDMAERFPTMFPQEMIVEMLDMGQADKYMDLASSATRAAEYENEKILGGEHSDSPAEWEDSLIHWHVHVKAMQDISFKSKNTPEEVRQALKDHVMATEMLLMNMSEKNQALSQSLAAIPNFPLFLAMPPLPPMPPQGSNGGSMSPQGEDPIQGQMPMSMTQSDMMPPEQMPPDEFATQMPEVSGDMIPETQYVNKGN
jgi:hypothetical protein